MAYEQKDMSGSLFKNDRKTTENHPDYNGSVKINGQEMWISAWLKESNNGVKFMSLAFNPKQQQAPPSAPAQQAMGDDQDIPF